MTTADLSPFAVEKQVEAAPRPGLFARLEMAAVFGILLLMSGALLAPLFSPDQNPDAVPWLRTMWLPVYGMIAALALRDPLRITRVAVGVAMGMVLVGWAFASSRWSIHPDITVRRSIALLFTTLFGLYLAARLDWKSLIEMLAKVFVLLAVGSYVASLLFPGLGARDPIHPGAWNGLWYEKNQMGGLMTHGALVCAVAALFDPGRRKLWTVGSVLCVGAVVMTESTTSLLGVAVALGSLAVILLLRRGGAVRLGTIWLGVAGAGAFVGLIAVAPALFFKLIGKDPSLTGRTDIWAAVLHRVELHPVLGYGFGAVWGDPWGPAWFIRHEVKWLAPTAHNGWLDILLQLGGVGLVLAAAHFLLTAAAAGGRLLRGVEGCWVIPFVAVFALLSVSESTLLQYNGLPWLIYTVISAKLFEWRGLSGAPAPRVPTVKLFPDA
ncbi:MAG TPA: O-antigen ligase family protein [Caulobacteraceae bacterium]|nr:O-antigen ligase family protein [Caulobacteraceae bacterium]